MNYIKKRLTRGEHVVYEGHVSWTPLIIETMFFLVIISIVAGVIGGMTDARYMYLTLIFGMLAFLVSRIPSILYNVGSEMVITNHNIHSKSGIVRIGDDREAALDRIDRVDVDMHSVIQRLFDFGDIAFQTVGSDNDFFYFKRIAHPYAMKDAYNQARIAYDKEIGRGDAEPSRPSKRHSRR